RTAYRGRRDHGIRGDTQLGHAALSISRTDAVSAADGLRYTSSAHGVVEHGRTALRVADLPARVDRHRIGADLGTSGTHPVGERLAAPGRAHHVGLLDG